MLVAIRLGLECHLALRAVKFDDVLGLLHFSSLSSFTDLNAWLLCMCLCSLKIVECIFTYLTGVLRIVHEVVSDMDP